MQQLTEIRWHARGGQGGVTAAKMTAEVALSQDKFFQAFPEYGPERSGAPLVAFTRISDEPINIYSAIEHPNYILVLDDTLVGTVDVAAGAVEDAVIIINSDEDAAALARRGGLENWKVYTVPATTIALETIKRAIPNTPLIGAFVKISGLFEIEGVLAQVRDSLSKKFGDEVVNANLEAVRRGYEEVTGA